MTKIFSKRERSTGLTRTRQKDKKIGKEKTEFFSPNSNYGKEEYIFVVTRKTKVFTKFTEK